MSYQKDRDEFLTIMHDEGMPLDTARKLMRYSQTLHRLAEAQCNGDWPYNGDRDMPYRAQGESAENFAVRRAKHDKRYTTCPNCEASGVLKSAMRTSSECFEAPCADNGTSPLIPHKVCPDCRTQELVRACLKQASIDYWTTHDLATHNMDRTPRTDYSFAPKFSGDPRGCVFKVTVPSKRTNDWGKEGICVPVRER